MNANASAPGAVLGYSSSHDTSSAWQRRQTWDLTHLSTKYPWLRVDAQTLTEFRSPFQWVDDTEADASSSSSDGGSAHADQQELKRKPLHKHKHTLRGRDAQYSLASPNKARGSHRHDASASPRKRKQAQSSRRGLDDTKANPAPTLRVEAVTTQLQTARSETDAEAHAKPPREAAALLSASVMADLQARKREERQQHQRKHKPVKAHSILSLSLPALHKPLQAAAAPATASLSSQLALLTKQELALQQRVLQQIETEKAKLPLTFLFERNLDKTYCKQQCVATITSIFVKLQHRLMFYAFHRWLAWCRALVDDERRQAAVQRAQKKALAFFETLASDAYIGTIDRAFHKWLANARQLAAEEMRAAAVTIQTQYRQRKARGLLHELKQASMDREYKRSVEIQRLLRFESYGTAMKWSTLRNGLNLLLLSLCAKRIQYFFRRIRTRRRIARRVQRKHAATRIQCRWRIQLARRRLVILRKAQQIQLAREHAACVHIQRHARGYIARQHAALRRLHLSREHVSACVVQRAWRQYSGRKRLHERCQCRRKLLDEERARQDELARIEAARRHEQRRTEMAVSIQRAVRGFLGRCHAKRQRYVRDLERAVRRVQLSWRKSKGRYALHLRFAAQRDRLDGRRNAAVLLLQCHVRRLHATRQRDALRSERQQRQASAVVIQSVVRGRHARQVYRAKQQSTVAIQCAWRGRQARQARDRRKQERLVQEQQRCAATLTLQCAARSYRARRLTRQLRHERQQLELMLEQSAVLIQKRARGMEARKVAVLLKQAMRVVDLQQRRAYGNSTQRKVTQSPLLAFLTSQYLAKPADLTASRDAEEEEPVAYTREQQQWLRWQIDAATQQMACEDTAVVLLQRHFRGYRTRVQFVVLQIHRRDRLVLENRMALKIQRIARGFVARRRVHRLQAKKKADAIKDAYIQERKWKEFERAFEERYKQEQMTLQLQRLQTLERQIKDAKREAEVAKWQAEAAAFRKQELEAQLKAKTLEKALRRASHARGEGADEDDDESAAVLGPAWEYVADAYGNGYYYNATTGESSWAKPLVDGSTQPSLSKKKVEKEKTKAETKKTATNPSDISAPPITETVAATQPVPETVARKGFCTKCKAVEADKECLDCLSSDLFSECLYCYACFTQDHGLVGSKTHHDFKVLKPLVFPSRCLHSKCLAADTAAPGLKAPASYYCSECPSNARFSCESCFPVVHESAQASHHIPASLHFRAGSLLCVECHAVLATRHCTQCDEAFCARCYTDLHDPSAIYATKHGHEFTALEILKDDLTTERDAYCVDCETKRCTRLCNLCGDGFCERCFASAHAKGHKALHTWISWDSFATHGDWLEIVDTKTGKTVFFNLETKESTHVQPFVMKSGEERHRMLFQEREAALKKKTLELESEIVKLQEQVTTLARENEKVNDKEKKRLDAMAADEESTQTKSKRKRNGLFGKLFGRKDTNDKKKMVAVDKTLSPNEAKRLALQQSVLENPADMALINSKLKTRDRALKEEAAKQTVGTKLFEQTMVVQLATTTASDPTT